MRTDEHNCPRKHRSWEAVAKCIWRNADVDGPGRWCSVSYCHAAPIVYLFETKAEARAAKELIDGSGCGGCCTGTHELVRLPAVTASSL